MYIKGDYWMTCDVCGFAIRKSQMRETWDGLWVCKKDWEPKHPQLTIRSIPDDQRVPVSRPGKDCLVGSTTVGTTAAVGARTLILTDASSLSLGDSIGVTLDDGIVQWCLLSASPSGNTVSLSEPPLWDSATAGNNVYLSSMADVNFVSSLEYDPELTTEMVTDITGTTATGNGTIITIGVPRPSQYGVCWNTTGTPTISDSKTQEGSVNSKGTFTSNINGLSGKTAYFIRSYATNTTDTFYGNEMTFTTVEALPSEDDLELYYKFDETTGVTCSDEKGNYDGTFTNGPGDDSQWVTGQTNNALDFDGSNDYVDINDALQSTFRDSFSISFWVKPDDGQPASTEELFGTKSAGDYINAILQTNGDLHINYKANGSDIQTVVGADSTGFTNGAQSNFTHIVIIFEKDVQTSVYINKTIKAGPVDLSGWAGNQEAYTSTDDIYIGVRNGDTDYFAGLIDEFRIYSKALTSDEVTALYNNDA